MVRAEAMGKVAAEVLPSIFHAPGLIRPSSPSPSGGRPISSQRASVIVTPTERFAAVAAKVIGTAITLSVSERGRCALALTGGTTPAPVYLELSRLAEIPWDKVDVFFGDERAVPLSDPASNFRMARTSLLDRIAIPAGQVHPMPAGRADRDQAADEYAGLLPPALDVLLLGMGADGHIASLFPGSPALAEQGRHVVPVTGPTSPAERMTITPPVIAAARTIYLMITGSGKAAMVARAIEGALQPESVPAQLARRGTWLLDDAAAALLHSPGE